MASTLILPPSWFDLRRYDGTALLDFEEWRTQVSNRVHLLSLLINELWEQFDEQFAKIQANPFFDLGFVDKYVSDKAVYPLTFGVAQQMVAVLAPSSPGPRDSCDEKLQQAGQESFAMQLHLTVDLGGSESQIRNHFEACIKAALAAHRKRFSRPREAGLTAAVLKSWGQFQLLPYQDLMLWHRRQKRTMPSDTLMAEWLYAEQDGDKDKARETRHKAASTFTLIMLRQLAIAATAS